jgi:hypothetical protein
MSRKRAAMPPGYVAIAERLLELIERWCALEPGLPDLRWLDPGDTVFVGSIASPEACRRRASLAADARAALPGMRHAARCGEQRTRRQGSAERGRREHLHSMRHPARIQRRPHVDEAFAGGLREATARVPRDATRDASRSTRPLRQARHGEDATRRLARGIAPPHTARHALAAVLRQLSERRARRADRAGGHARRRALRRAPLRPVRHALGWRVASHAGGDRRPSDAPPRAAVPAPGAAVPAQAAERCRARTSGAPRSENAPARRLGAAKGA